MAVNNINDVIDEPILEASQNSFYLPLSEPIQYYYKLKYPEVYCLRSSTVLDLLNNKQVLADLNKSVNSFINYVSESFKVDRSQGFVKNNKETETAKLPADSNELATYRLNTDVEDAKLPIHDNRWGTYDLNTEVGSCEKQTDLFKMTASTDFSVYDSVHSIKVPLRTYGNKSRAVRFASELFSTVGRHSSVAEVTNQMSGLVFDRVEKAASLPKMGCKNIPSASRTLKKERELSFSPYFRKQSGSASNIRKKE